MPLYYFDTRDDDEVTRDDVGLRLDGVQAARDLAAKSLAELAVDALPGSSRRCLGVDVRDERSAVLTTELIFEARLAGRAD
jgi:hypothetical protein